MKTKFFAVLCGVIFTSVQLLATSVPENTKTLPLSVKTQILSELKYPLSAKSEKIEGDVVIKIVFTDNNTIKLIDYSASNIKLGDYVSKKFAQLKINSDSVTLNKEYSLKIKFELL